MKSSSRRTRRKRHDLARLRPDPVPRHVSWSGGPVAGGTRAGPGTAVPPSVASTGEDVGGAGAGSVAGPTSVTAPHWPQNFARSGSGFPHWGQARAAIRVAETIVVLPPARASASPKEEGRAQKSKREPKRASASAERGSASPKRVTVRILFSSWRRGEVLFSWTISVPPLGALGGERRGARRRGDDSSASSLRLFTNKERYACVSRLGFGSDFRP